MFLAVLGFGAVLALFCLGAAIRIRRRVRVDGRLERQFTFRARRFALLFESAVLFLLVLMGLGVSLGASSNAVALLTSWIAIAATVLPLLMIMFIPGLIGWPK